MRVGLINSAKSKAPGDRRFCDSTGFGTEAFFLKLSSLQSCPDQEILAWLNSFFVFFGTEALITRILVHEKLLLPGNLGFGGTRMRSNIASVPNLRTPGTQLEHFTLF